MHLAIENYKYPYQVELIDSPKIDEIAPVFTISRADKTYGVYRQLSNLATVYVIISDNGYYRQSGPRHPQSLVDHIHNTIKTINGALKSPQMPITDNHMVIEIKVAICDDLPITLDITIIPPPTALKWYNISTSTRANICNLATLNMRKQDIIRDILVFTSDPVLMKYVQKGVPWTAKYVGSLVDSAISDYKNGNSDYSHYVVIDNTNTIVAYFSLRPYKDSKQLRLITFPNRGYGSVIVEYLRYTTHYAFVVPENIPSNRLFQSNEYEFKGIVDRLNLYYSQSPNVL